MLRRVLDWILLTKRLDGARAALAAEEKRAGVPIQQARLVAEVMRRVAEPAETLPPGNPAAVIVALGREAVAAILAAPAASPDSLAQALDQTPHGVLVAAVGGDEAALAATREALLAPLPGPRPSAAPEDDKRAARVRSFVEALLWNADAPRRTVDRLLLIRFGRLALVAIVVVLLALGIQRLTRGKNLAAGKPLKTSSSWSGCAADPTCEGQLLFHTSDEDRPWAQVDLLKPQPIHRIMVRNRPDCCGDRIVPLVVEVSSDGQRWTEVGRKTEEFSTWNLTFPAREARYVKLHVDRKSTFHIKELIVQ